MRSVGLRKMKNAGQRLAFKEIVRPKRWLGALRRNNAAAKKCDTWRPRLNSGPGPLAHAEGPVTPCDGFAVGDLKACAGGASRTDSNALCGLHGSGGNAF